MNMNEPLPSPQGPASTLVRPLPPPGSSHTHSEDAVSASLPLHVQRSHSTRSMVATVRAGSPSSSSGFSSSFSASFSSWQQQQHGSSSTPSISLPNFPSRTQQLLSLDNFHSPNVASVAEAGDDRMDTATPIPMTTYMAQYDAAFRDFMSTPTQFLSHSRSTPTSIHGGSYVPFIESGSFSLHRHRPNHPSRSSNSNAHSSSARVVGDIDEQGHGGNFLADSNRRDGSSSRPKPAGSIKTQNDNHNNSNNYNNDNDNAQPSKPKEAPGALRHGYSVRSHVMHAGSLRVPYEVMADDSKPDLHDNLHLAPEHVYIPLP